MEKTDQTPHKKMRTPLLLLNASLLAIGVCGGLMVMRLYFLHGGRRVCLPSWLETGAWPVNFIPLLLTYLGRRRREGPAAKLFLMKGPVFIPAAIIGVLTGLDDYLYAYGGARLPVSTVSLITATKLVFNAVFAFFLLKQKFTPYSIKALALLTVGSGVLALHTSSDRPKGEQKNEYYVGFFMMTASMVLYGLILPVVELTYNKTSR